MTLQGANFIGNQEDQEFATVLQAYNNKEKNALVLKNKPVSKSKFFEVNFSWSHEA